MAALCAGAALSCLIGVLTTFAGEPATASGLSRIALIHAPAAALSLALYGAVTLLLCFCAQVQPPGRATALWRIARAVLPTGTILGLVAVATQFLFDRPATGAWWVWDRELASETVLLVLYFGLIGLHAAIDDRRRLQRAAAAAALAGIPAVLGAYALGGPAALAAPATAAFSASSILVTLGLSLYALTAVVLRVRCLMLEQQREAAFGFAACRSSA